MANQQADGSIIVDTQIDNTGFAAGSAEMQRAIKSLNTAVGNLGPTFHKALNGSASALSTFDAKSASLEDKIVEIEQEMERLGNTRIETDDFKWYAAEAEKAREKLAELEDRQDKMSTTGVKEYSRAWESVQYDIDRTKEKIADLEATKTNLMQSGQAYQMGSDTAEYAQLSQQLETAKQKLASMNEQAAELPRKIDDAGNRTSRMGKLAKGVSSAFGKIASVVGAGLKKGMSSFINKIKSARKSADGLHKKFLKMSLAMLGMRGIWGGIRQLVTSALNNNEQLQNQLNGLKGVLGEALAPIINRLVKGLATLVSFADRLYQIFTGISLISKYNAKQTASTSSSLGSATKNAKKLTRQLAGFDELNVLSKNDTDSSGGGCGASGATFDPVSLSKEMQDFIDKFKELWAAGDFYGIGSLISSKIVGALQGIDWESIKAKAFKGGKSFAEILNGMFEYSDADGNTLMSSIGKTIGEAFNTLLSVVDGFATNLHWGSLGSELSNGISTALKTIDWKLLFKTAIDLGTGFGDYINGIISYKDKDGDSLAKNLGMGLSNAVHTAFLFLIGFIKTIDWQQVGTAIAEFIQGIDWVQLFTDAFTLIGEAVEGLIDILIGFIEGLDWGKATQDIFKIIGSLFTSIDWTKLAEKLARLLGDLVGASLRVAAELIIGIGEFVQKIIDGIKDYFAQYFSWDDEPEQIIAGLWKGIKNALSNIGTWIKTHIIDPFLEGVRKGFGIHSPSTKMAEIGGYLIDGLKNGLSGIWEKIKEKFTELWTNLKGWFTDKKDSIKVLGSEVIDNIKSGIGGIWSKLKEKFTDFWTKLKEWFTNKVEAFKKLGSDMITKIKTGIANIWSTIKDKFTTFWTSLSGWFSGKVQSFKSLGSNMIDKIKNGVGSVWSTIKEKFTSFWTSLKGWFDGKVESFKNLGKNIILGIKNGITAKITEVKNAITSGLESAVDGAKKFLGIASPSKLFRDEVGKFISLGIGKGILGQIPAVIKDTATLASAIQDEMDSNKYAISPITTDGASTLKAGMDSFAGIITDGFTRLIDRLESIASGVSFTSPVAAHIVPYASRDNSPVDWRALFEASNDDLINALMQISREQTDEIRRIVEALDLTVNIDERAEADRVIREIKRRTLATKQNPLLTQ